MIGFVYKIWNDDDDKIYIGSTIQGLNARFQGHKDKHKIETLKNYNCSLFKHYRELGFNKFHRPQFTDKTVRMRTENDPCIYQPLDRHRNS